MWNRIQEASPLTDSLKERLNGFELKDASEGILVLERMLKVFEHPKIKLLLYVSIAWLIFYWIAKWMILKRLASWQARLGVRLCAFCVNAAMLSVLIPYLILGREYLEASVKSVDYTWRMIEKIRK